MLNQSVYFPARTGDKYESFYQNGVNLTQSSSSISITPDFKKLLNPGMLFTTPEKLLRDKIALENGDLARLHYYSY